MVVEFNLYDGFGSTEEVTFIEIKDNSRTHIYGQPKPSVVLIS